MADLLPKTIRLEIVTPDRLVFTGDVEEVTLPGLDGYVGILPGHAPLLSGLKIGVISYRQAAQESLLFCSWGLVEVLPGQVSVLAEVIESVLDIDVDEARAKKEGADRLFRSKDPDTDYAAAVEMWEKARARLEVAGG